MTAIMLTRVDERRNMARYYKLDIQPTLFGESSLVREWGRIGRAGTVRIEAYPTRGKADLALILKWAEKRRRGYR
ncbi:WGR domain-containing protein [Bradyrhizobium sp. CSA207]|uniref:WGR domain-containing protein n=1 Tax=Bradyrhizobium sp. CSA207 TaxID=2698826 RepID=UPI0023B11CCC|nr:WGR domain-containing protein [Bradyrhizobium sp. CSA207]MDE5440412.1 WGR domain-containing protein [Bradyrhizobium sp. CSA207]